MDRLITEEDKKEKRKFSSDVREQPRDVYSPKYKKGREFIHHVLFLFLSHLILN